MRKLFLVLFALLTALAVAQQPPAANSGMLKAMKDIKGRVYGKLVDAATRKPVEYAPVMVLWYNKDSLVGGAISQENGEFNIENLPSMGGFRFRVKQAGYKAYETKIYIQMPSKIEQDLGDIALEVDEKLLNTVEVTADKNTVVMSIDKRTYNVDKDLSVKGGTGVDVMKNVPGVTVDAEGNVELRNQSPMLFVDGRPSNLTLQQIPADQIDRVEVITNPSAKYDASASGGILNVIMKKNLKPGYNGMIMTYVGTGDRYGGMVNLNVKEGKWNFTSMYSYNQAYNLTTGYTRRTQLDSNQAPLGYFSQDNRTAQLNRFNFGKLGIDYNITNRNTLSLNTMIMGGIFKTNDHQVFDVQNAGRNSLLTGLRVNDQKAAWQNFNAQLMYKKTYPKQGKELTADLNFNHTESTNGYDFNTWTSLVPDTMAIPPEYQTNNGFSNANQYVFQLDFVNPESDVKKLETGMKLFFKNSNAINHTFDRAEPSDAMIEVGSLSNNYVINDMVNAAYVNYSNKTKKDLNYQAGLRFEQSFYEGRIVDKGQSFSYNYPFGGADILKSIFPAIYLSKKLSKGREWQFNISRKIQRPNFFQLMPVTMMADRQNIRRGNPELRPEFRNIVEANFNKIYTKGSYLGSLYGRYEEQPITDVAYPMIEQPTVLYNTTVNGRNSFRYGTEHTWKHTFYKNLDMTLNGNVSYIFIRGLVVPTEPEVTATGFTFNGKMILAYKFPKQYTLQYNVNYESPRILLLGSTIPNYGMDLSLNKMFGAKWIFNITLSDMFNTRRFGAYYQTPYYTQDISRRRESRYVRFTATYLFGKMDASIFKRGKQLKNLDQGGGNPDGLDFGK